MEVREPSGKYVAATASSLDHVGAVPDGWEDVRLTDVAKLESGHTPSRRVLSYWSGSIPWVSLHDTDGLDALEILDTAQRVTDEGIKNSSARLLPRGTVVFSRTATVGKATVLGRDMATSQDFANYICGPRVHNRFLMYLLRSMKGRWQRLVAGSIHNTIYMPVFEKLRVALPPLHEQLAIADALNDVDSLIDSLEQLLTKKRQIKQGAMQELLTGKRRLPRFDRPWATKRLDALGTFLKGSGVTRDEAFSGDLPCVRYGEIYTTHTDHIRAFESWISPAVAATATRIKQGDLLFAGSGETKEEIGKCIAFLDDFEAYAGGDIVVLRPTVAVSPVFMGYAINLPEVVRQKASLGQGDAVVHVSATALAGVMVSLPAVDEQRAIAQVLSDIDADLFAIEAHLVKARDLKQAMMQVLLTGRIRLVEAEAA